ncbi:MAG: AAA family ATPase [Myxococcales bacterium]|nr:AAA family ATPase [Myxococcales bacterium]
MAELLSFPVICWRLGPELVGGLALGTGLTLVRSDAKKVVAALGQELRSPHVEVRPPMLEARLDRATVSIRPTYRTDDGDFPMPHTLDVAVDLVDGKLPRGGRVCHLPRLGRSFFYDDIEQLDTLVTHFAREQLRGYSPEQLVSFLLVGEPWLEHVNVRIKPSKSGKWREPPVSTPRLDQIAEVLPAKSRSRGRLAAAAWERANEVSEIAGLLENPRGSLMLVGHRGVGKSQILMDAIKKAARHKEAPRFWRTAAHRLTSGARFLGDWQQLCEQMVTELSAARGVLWVEDVLTLLHLGGSGPEDSVAAFLAPFMATEGLRLVGEVSPRGLDLARSKLPSFVERFQLVNIEELSSAQVRAVIGRFAAAAERDLSIRFEPRAQRLAHRLLERHVRYERFPGKAASMMRECVHTAQQDERDVIGEADVMERFILRSGMPADLLDDRILLDPAELSQTIGSSIVGQPEAVDEVCRVVKAFKAGLSDPRRPLATLLFAGPTGVGKTAMAKTLAGYLFGQGPEDAPLVRVDMSELQYAGQIRRLIGDASGEPGELVRKLRQRPFGVVLFDEIEKAHPVFFDTLLTVLDEGILVDALGRETDFRGTVVILTTNLGTGSGGSLGFSRARVGHDLSAVRRFFRPEFFNRIDRVVHFEPLSLEAVRGIARIELGALAGREGIQSRRLKLTFTHALVEHVVKLGFDPDYGARALQRVVEQQVVAVVGRFLLARPDLRDASLSVDVAEGSVVVVRAG